jgi:hypothetical protein
MRTSTVLSLLLQLVLRDQAKGVNYACPIAPRTHISSPFESQERPLQVRLSNLSYYCHRSHMQLIFLTILTIPAELNTTIKRCIVLVIFNNDLDQLLIFASTNIIFLNQGSLY